MTLVTRKSENRFPSLFDEFFRPDWVGGMQSMSATVPAINIKETETRFELELAAPGLKKDQFHIEVEQNLLTIASERKEENEEKNSEGTYSRREFSYSSFKRSFTLPETVDSERIEAQYENGVLHVAIPKKEEALPKPKRLIEIA